MTNTKTLLLEEILYATEENRLKWERREFLGVWYVAKIKDGYGLSFFPHIIAKYDLKLHVGDIQPQTHSIARGGPMLKRIYKAIIENLKRADEIAMYEELDRQKKAEEVLFKLLEEVSHPATKVGGL